VGKNEEEAKVLKRAKKICCPIYPKEPFHESCGMIMAASAASKQRKKSS